MSVVGKEDEEHIILGKINGVYGVKGWVKVYSYTDPRERITQYRPWYLRGRNGWAEVEIESGRPQAKTVIAKLAGCDDRDTAQTFIGREIAVTRAQLDEYNKDGYLWRDLIGLDVRNEQGFRFGRVVRMMETGANDVLVIRNDADESTGVTETLIPWTLGHAVIRVDEEGILVDWGEDY